MKQKIKSACLLVAVLMSTQTQAQVTIGLDEAPVSGALLQLKEQTVNGGDPNSAKGLGLPRVNLVQHKKLYPMFENDGAGGYKLGSTSYTKVTEDRNHVGLVVYNLTEDNNFCPGLHVWDGEDWQALKPYTFYPDIEVSDADGNPYIGKWLTLDQPCNPNASGLGAYWLTSSLYTTQKTGGGAFSSGSPILNPAIYHTKTDPSADPILLAKTTPFHVSNKTDFATLPEVIYGISDIQFNTREELNITESASDFAKKFGLLYTYSQAQEVCPTGWHLPTSADWTHITGIFGGEVEFINTMYTNKYYTDNGYYVGGWSLDDTRPFSMQWIQNTWSYPILATPSGFNALPSGYASDDSRLDPPLQADYFVRNFYMWFSDAKSLILSNISYYQIADKDNGGLLDESYGSVRCVKD